MDGSSSTSRSSDEQFVLYRFLGNNIESEEELTKSETTLLKDKVVTIRLDGARLWNCDALSLAQNIGYFKKVFSQNPTLTSENSCTTTVIELKSSNRVGVRAFDTIANGYLREKEIRMTSKNVAALELAATFLDIEDLRAACHHFIALKPGNVLLTDCIKYPTSIKRGGDRWADEGPDLLAIEELNRWAVGEPQGCFTCGVCQREFDRPSHLAMHARMHTRERPHGCSQCHMTFRRAYCLKLHEVIHTGRREFQCPVCGWAFAVRYNLVNHLKTHTGEHRKHQCHLCQKVMTSSSNLKLHVRAVHFNARPARCPICPKAFKMKKHLQNHLLVHTKIRDFKCQVCQRAFSRKESLKIHMVVHTGIRPHRCPDCGKGFVTRNRLTTHQFTHSDHKPFSCHICHNTFTMKATMQQHVARHATKK